MKEEAPFWAITKVMIKTYSDPNLNNIKKNDNIESSIFTKIDILAYQKWAKWQISLFQDGSFIKLKVLNSKTGRILTSKQFWKDCLFSGHCNKNN